MSKLTNMRAATFPVDLFWRVGLYYYEWGIMDVLD